MVYRDLRRVLLEPQSEYRSAMLPMCQPPLRRNGYRLLRRTLALFLHGLTARLGSLGLERANLLTSQTSDTRRSDRVNPSILFEALEDSTVGIAEAELGKGFEAFGFTVLPLKFQASKCIDEVGFPVLTLRCKKGVFVI